MVNLRCSADESKPWIFYFMAIAEAPRIVDISNLVNTKIKELPDLSSSEISIAVTFVGSERGRELMDKDTQLRQRTYAWLISRVTGDRALQTVDRIWFEETWRNRIRRWEGAFNLGALDECPDVVEVKYPIKGEVLESEADETLSSIQKKGYNFYCARVIIHKRSPLTLTVPPKVELIKR